jgi:hypothetical protein
MNTNYKRTYKTGAGLAFLMLFIIAMSEEPEAVDIAWFILFIDIAMLILLFIVQPSNKKTEDERD